MKKKFLALLLCIVMLASVSVVAAGCKSNTVSTEPQTTAAPQTSVPETTVGGSQPVSTSDVTVLGEGATEFTFTVTDLDGKETIFEIHTDKATVGEALVDLGLIAGETGDYGLYVKTVNGVTLDYDKDGKYWAFYVNGEYSVTSVDSTKIEPGASYAFKAE